MIMMVVNVHGTSFLPIRHGKGQLTTLFRSLSKYHYDN